MKRLSLALAVFFCVSSARIVNAEASELKTVPARTLTLKVPATWKQKESTSSMRAAEFLIPGKPADAELVVFYFGGPTGGVKANIDRWIGQFKKDGLKLAMLQGKCQAGSYILVDCQGTWNKPDGPPFASKTVPTPNSRVLNVIVVEEMGDEKDYYFMKLSGHEDVVGDQVDALREAIGADIKSEKKFDLESAE
ncbi:MAG: hypothetical protein KDB00_11340 [Planctomycetales bacterium]|nr:hypothetical protein [Planctomycetales bacterium]